MPPFFVATTQFGCKKGCYRNHFKLSLRYIGFLPHNFFRGLNFVDRCKKYLLSQPIVERLQQLVTLATTNIALRVVLLVLQYEVDIATIFLMVATTSSFCNVKSLLYAVVTIVAKNRYILQLAIWSLHVVLLALQY